MIMAVYNKTSSVLRLFFDYLLDLFSVFRKTNFSIKMPDFPPVIRRIPSTWEKIATSKYLINLTYFIIY